MSKTYVDVEVYNSPRVSLQGTLPQSLSGSCDLIEQFLLELCQNSSDTLHLIQVCEWEGEGEVYYSAHCVLLPPCLPAELASTTIPKLWPLLLFFESGIIEF